MIGKSRSKLFFKVISQGRGPVHVLEIGPTELDHDTTNLGLDIAIVARRRHVDVSLEGVGVRSLKILELAV